MIQHKLNKLRYKQHRYLQGGFGLALSGMCLFIYDNRAHCYIWHFIFKDAAKSERDNSNRKSSQTALLIAELIKLKQIDLYILHYLVYFLTLNISLIMVSKLSSEKQLPSSDEITWNFILIYLLMCWEKKGDSCSNATHMSWSSRMYTFKYIRKENVPPSHRRLQISSSVS